MPRFFLFISSSNKVRCYLRLNISKRDCRWKRKQIVLVIASKCWDITQLAQGIAQSFTCDLLEMYVHNRLLSFYQAYRVIGCH